MPIIQAGVNICIVVIQMILQDVYGTEKYFKERVGVASPLLDVRMALSETPIIKPGSVTVFIGSTSMRKDLCCGRYTNIAAQVLRYSTT